MRRGPGDPEGVPRRQILHALAVAPVALAGCAGARPAVTPPGPGDAVAASGPGEESRSVREDAAAVRRFVLAADAEPASVFRAAGARPGEPR
jgi:hypothetical protein